MIRNIHHCVAIGGCAHLEAQQPAPHTLKARLCRQLADQLLHKTTFDLPVVTERTLEIGKQAVNAMAEAGERIARETNTSIELVVLNVVSFCMDELPTTARQQHLLRNIIDCYDGVDQYSAIRAGHRVWERMRAECFVLQIDEEV